MQMGDAPGTQSPDAVREGLRAHFRSMGGATTRSRAVSTRPLVAAFGWSLRHLGTQHDAAEFLTKLMHALSASLAKLADGTSLREFDLHFCSDVISTVQWVDAALSTGSHSTTSVREAAKAHATRQTAGSLLHYARRVQC